MDDLLGMYRLGSRYQVFVPAEMQTADPVIDHEFVHASLAASTTTGLLHQTLAFLARTDVRWEPVAAMAVDLARGTHEATAIFQELQLTTAGAWPSIPASFRPWLRPLSELCDELEGPPIFKVHVAHAIARVAMNDPLETLLSMDTQQLLSDDSGRWLPRADDRYLQLLDSLHRRIDDLQQVALEVGSSVVTSQVDGETFRKFLVRRRRVSATTAALLQDRMASMAPGLSVASSGTESLQGAWTKVEQHLRKSLPADSGDALLGWSIDFSDDSDEDQPDPLISRLEINRQNTDLQVWRVRDRSDLPSAPAAILVTHARTDLRVSPTLTVSSGSYYARYFWSDGEPYSAFAAYAISNGLEVLVDASTPLILSDVSMTPNTELPCAETRALGAWLVAGLTPEILDELADPALFHLRLIPWPTSGVATAMFVAPNRPHAFLATVAGAGLGLLAEVAHERGMEPARQAWADSIYRAFMATFPHCVPTEGVRTQ